ncbi:unnamed protein product, partial [Brassica oleracea]
MDIRRNLNLLRGDFGTRRIGTIDCFKGIYTTRSMPLRTYLQDAICRGLSYGSISGIRLIMVCVKVVKVVKGDMVGFDLEYDLRNCFWGSKWFGDHDSHCVWNLRLFVTYENEKGHGATNRDDYKDQARWSSPSIQDFGNLLKSEVYIWTSDHGRWIDSKHILMAHNRRFPHSHEISSYLNESTVMGTDWVTIMEHMRLWRTYSF